MHLKEEYKRKIEAEHAHFQTRIAAYKLNPTRLAAEDRTKHLAHLETLEQRVASSQQRLKDLDNADETVWHEIKEDVESTWVALQNDIEEAIRHMGE